MNDPYFKYLKQSCEKFGFQPTDIGLTNQDIDSIKSWTPRLCINITGNRIYTHIVRVFQCCIEGILRSKMKIKRNWKEDAPDLEPEAEDTYFSDNEMVAKLVTEKSLRKLLAQVLAQGRLLNI